MTKQHNPEVLQIEELEQETRLAIFKGQQERVKFLFEKAERLFTTACDNTRAMMANKFILPITQLLEMNFNWGRKYLNLFPRQLKAEYCRQINSSGI